MFDIFNIYPSLHVLHKNGQCLVIEIISLIAIKLMKRLLAQMLEMNAKISKDIATDSGIISIKK
jgi:hypothetical protein